MLDSLKPFQRFVKLTQTKPLLSCLNFARSRTKMPSLQRKTNLVAPHVKTVKAVCFDFDGTILDSNSIKAREVQRLGEKLPGSNQMIRQLQAKQPPLDRREIIEQIGVTYNLSEHQKQQMISDLSARLHKAVVKCKFMPGAEACIRSLREQSIPIYLNSATPEDKLQKIVEDLNLTKTFSLVLGRPANKEQNIRTVLAHAEVAAENLLMVGDGADDQQSAHTIGCNFQPVFNFRGETKGELKTLSNLAELTNNWIIAHTIKV